MEYVNKILQWNVNGLQSRLPRLQSLVDRNQPKIIALQEIKLTDDGFRYFRGFTLYKRCRHVAGGGGVLLAINNNIPSTQIQLNTTLEAVACKVYFDNFCLNICNVYFNDDADITAQTFNNLVKSIPSPRLILGDFNVKHSLWGSPDNDPRGVAIFNVILNNNLCVLNDGSPTFYRASQDLCSHLDLSICSNLI